MFEELDFERLSDRMLSNVDDKFDKREGSVIYDAVAPAAMELADFYIALDMVMDESFAESASYYYLIKRAAERGIIPREETCAVCRMDVAPAGAPVSAGDRFNLGDLNYTVVSAIDADAGIYQIECETAGTIGNQQLGNLLPVETKNELNSLEAAVLTEIIIPGEEEEDVESFRERYFASFDNEPFGGNKADYIAKVNDIAGVGGCKPYRAWTGGYNPAKMMPGKAVLDWFEQQSRETLGSEVYTWINTVLNAAKEKLLTVGGTVRVCIISSEYMAPSPALIRIVQEELDPDGTAAEGDGIAPIGHVVRVVGVNEVTIDVSAAIEYAAGYSFSNMKEPVESVVDSYFLELRENWASNDKLIVRISQIESRLLELEGIIDVKDTALNGNKENFVLDTDSVPVRGDVLG